MKMATRVIEQDRRTPISLGDFDHHCDLLYHHCGRTELGSLVSFASKSSLPATVITINNGDTSGNSNGATSGTVTDTVPDEVVTFSRGVNVCAGKKPDMPNNTDCIVDAMAHVGPQAGTNVTKGNQDGLEVDHVSRHHSLLDKWNVHRQCPLAFGCGISEGLYDEEGTGPGADRRTLTAARQALRRE